MHVCIGVVGRMSREADLRRICVEKRAVERKSRVAEEEVERSESRVLRDTRNPVGIWQDHLLRLNTPWQPIEEKYREGKVKSTSEEE
jgi:hypothetical protein